MSKHNENILELVSKTIYETTFMSKDKNGSYRRQLDRIKKMVKMYAEEYAESILKTLSKILLQQRTQIITL